MVYNQLLLNCALCVCLDFVNERVKLVVEVGWLPDEVDLLIAREHHLILGYLLPGDLTVGGATYHRISNDLGTISRKYCVIQDCLLDSSCLRFGFIGVTILCVIPCILWSHHLLA